MSSTDDKPQVHNSQGRHLAQPSLLINNSILMFPSKHQHTPALKAENHAAFLDDGLHCRAMMEQFLVKVLQCKVGPPVNV